MKIGYTTGVFDMFHVGHLNILKRAKEHCDHLIVGVSTDELVEEYKHKRPVVPYEERAAIVKAIRYVDEVVPQVDRDKAAAQTALGFQIMFVGDDWKGSPLFTQVEAEFERRGVEVMYFPYTSGTSSTLLAEKLNSL